MGEAEEEEEECLRTDMKCKGCVGRTAGVRACVLRVYERLHARVHLAMDECVRHERKRERSAKKEKGVCMRACTREREREREKQTCDECERGYRGGHLENAKSRREIRIYQKSRSLFFIILSLPSLHRKSDVGRLVIPLSQRLTFVFRRETDFSISDLIEKFFK
ncbi:hypothetical protein DMN91_007222 [Ooceraea biroi]|uniref:Uncharacterized protein n=1 Tax=Ooceraea biroi TaxID=2015173 RepID=A0A3L8DL18_OOCBI|nr:hypothetical protein DMN91_007222 [Ooceraea biroi]